MNKDVDKIVCPASIGLDETGYFQKHHTTAAELAENGGVCKKCRDEFEKRYATQQLLRNGHDARQLDDTAAFVGDHIEPVVDFDFASLDPKENPLLELDECCRHTVINLGLMLWRRTPNAASQAVAFFHAFHCMLFASKLHPAQHLSGHEIGEAIGMKKGMFFKLVSQYRNRENMRRIGGSWNMDAREQHRDTIRKTHEKRTTTKQAVRRSTGTFAQRIARANSGG